ncbi:hypothetical protein [Kytococcus sedentarius]|uniref:hypothetical protein n=1 Tax=Kytococcus sedentarius TaxID=1276 RepID=UPI0019504402|nr:hypothetical protein [Kytococcus sedentarius]QRO86907.1 hypothetical protein I6J30_08645 [Kytococcus sedentarius]
MRAVFTGLAGARDGDHDRSVAASMADHARRSGPQENGVLLEEESSTTFEDG